MAKTLSTMLPLGSIAHPFSLPDPNGKVHEWKSLRGKRGTLVMFICNHCPYVVHLKSAISSLAQEYQKQDIACVAINSNDFEIYKDDAPAQMLIDSQTFGYSFPYLIDASQAVAKSYQAACTPDFYLFDVEDRLVYRGQFDDSRPGNDVAITGLDIRRALDALLQGASVVEQQKPSLGCNIKWKPGNEPNY